MPGVNILPSFHTPPTTADGYIIERAHSGSMEVWKNMCAHSNETFFTDEIAHPHFRSFLST